MRHFRLLLTIICLVASLWFCRVGIKSIREIVRSEVGSVERQLRDVVSSPID